VGVWGSVREVCWRGGGRGGGGGGETRLLALSRV